MKYFIYILIVIFLNGCYSSYPLNMTKEEYMSLSVEDRIKSKEKQEALDVALEIELVKNDTIKREHKNKLELQQNELVNDLYKRTNDKITVSISEGSFRSLGNDYYIPAFEVAKYEVKKIPVYEASKNKIHHFIWVTYQNIGLYLGVKPHEKYSMLDKYISSDGKYFSKVKNSLKPAIVLRNSKWRRGENSKVSFDGFYDAYNLNIYIYHQRGNLF